MNRRFIIYFIQIFRFIGSDLLETSACPTTHPYAYRHGLSCCKTQKEGNGDEWNPQSEWCDGSALDLRSRCCEGGATIRCLTLTAGKLCSDGNANGKL